MGNTIIHIISIFIRKCCCRTAAIFFSSSVIINGTACATCCRIVWIQILHFTWIFSAHSRLDPFLPLRSTLIFISTLWLDRKHRLMILWQINERHMHIFIMHSQSTKLKSNGKQNGEATLETFALCLTGGYWGIWEAARKKYTLDWGRAKIERRKNTSNSN